jgi:hypothetical protein
VFIVEFIKKDIMQQKKQYKNKNFKNKILENSKYNEQKPFTLAEAISKIMIDDYTYGDTIKQLQDYEITPESVIYKKKKL